MSTVSKKRHNVHMYCTEIEKGKRTTPTYMSLLTYIHRSLWPVQYMCPKRHNVCQRRLMYICQKRPVYICQKRHMYISKETCNKAVCVVCGA